MSSDVRRLLKKQKSERSKTKKITHPFAKYDDQARLICAVCNTIVKSENVWQAHLGSSQHRDNIAKLKALKEQQQQQRKRAAPATEQPASKRAKPLVSQYDDEDSDDMEDDDNVKEKEVEIEEEEEEEEEAGLPADFFDKNDDDNMEEEEEEGIPEEVEEEDAQQEDGGSNTLPTGFFDDPDEDARVHGSIAPAEQAELNLEQDMEEFKDAMIDVTKEAEEMQEEDDELFWQERNEDIFREQAELDSRVEKLKQMRQTGHIETLARQGENEISVGLKQSVRQVLKSNTVKKVTTMFDDMEEDSSSEEEEEDEDWRAQQLS